MSETMIEHIPAPGSAMAGAANAESQAAPEVNYAPPVPVEEQFTVSVRETRGDHITFGSVYVAGGGTARILGRNDLRRTATISCSTGAVFLCANGELASSIQSQGFSASPTASVPGMYLSSPAQVVRIESTGSIFAVAESGTAALVAFAEEFWDD